MDLGYKFCLGKWFIAFLFLVIQKATVKLLTHEPTCCFCSFTPSSTLMLIFWKVVVCNWVARFSILFPFRIGNKHVESWGPRDFSIAIRICQNFFSSPNNFKPLCSSSGRSISFCWISEVGGLRNIQIIQYLLRFLKRFPNLFSLYIAVLLIIFAKPTSSNWGVKIIIEATRMEKGGSSGLKEVSRMSKRGRIPRRATNLATTTTSLQPRRRSGRLAKLYWKDLSGISSEAEPIILDSDSSNADEEDGTRGEAVCSEDEEGKNKDGVLERDFSTYGKKGNAILGRLKKAEEVDRRKVK